MLRRVLLAVFLCHSTVAFRHVQLQSHRLLLQSPVICPRRSATQPYMSNKQEGNEAVKGDPFKSVSDGPTSEKPGTSPAQPNPEDVKSEQQVDLFTYVFGKPGELDRDLARLGTSRRRFLSINAASVIVALGANFLGVTSYLLGLLPDSKGLDLLPAELTGFYPVKGWKRYRGESAFEFQVPQKWLQDQAVMFANAAGPADRVQTMKKKAAPLVKTSVAFGPPKGDFKENVSVVKSKIPEGFTLRGIGEPAAAAQRLLDTAIAPAASGKKATLLKAFAEERAGREVYQFEYVVQLPSGLVLHNICAVASRADTLYSLTVLAPEEEWDGKKESLERIAQSFKLV